jgi:hypothetical protein
VWMALIAASVAPASGRSQGPIAGTGGTVSGQECKEGNLNVALLRDTFHQ